MLRELAEQGEVRPAHPVHAVTAALRSAAPDADVEDLEYTAFADAAMASVALLVGQVPRRVVISADVPGDLLVEHGDGTEADCTVAVPRKQVAAIHVDDGDAEDAITAVLGASEEPDLDAVERHVMDWFDPTELEDLVADLGEGK
jgi:hypothetical protein